MVSLTNEEEMKVVCHVGDIELSSRFGPCIITLSLSNANLGSVGTGTWVRLWNLQLHGWHW